MRMRVVVGVLVVAFAAAWAIGARGGGGRTLPATPSVPGAPSVSGSRAATRASPGYPGYRSMSVAELAAALKSKDFLLVNVHVPDEGGLAGTDLAIPYDQVDADLDRLPPNKDAKIVVYCKSGRMSQIAAAALDRRGYRSVYNLEGGMEAWRAAGNPLMPPGANR